MTRIEPRMCFGEYEAVHFIAAGGMGETWGGVDLGLTKAVVIKVLRPDLAEDTDAQNRFFREARIAAALQHGSIVSVIDYGAHDDLLYLVMARVDGVDLRAFLKAFCKKAKLEDLPPTLVGYIVGQILEALRYAHARPVGGKAYGVIHRDIKPSNVLVSSEGQVFVTDFGIARYATDITWQGRIVGTPGYMAPEQAECNACPQSDLFGAGAVAHYLLTGGAPLDHGNSAVDLTLAYRHPIPKVERDDIPPPLHEFLERSLAFGLGQRFETADDALSVLDKLKPFEATERNSTMLRRLYRSARCGWPPPPAFPWQFRPPR